MDSVSVCLYVEFFSRLDQVNVVDFVKLKFMCRIREWKMSARLQEG